LAFIVENVANNIPVNNAHGVPGGGEDTVVVALDKTGRTGWALRPYDRLGSDPGVRRIRYGRLMYNRELTLLIAPPAD
jgi:hypothetical protein